jgi:hypothetical protein
VNKQRVLFPWTHNSARSQMAEGFLRALAGNRFEVASAGPPSPPRPRNLALRQQLDVQSEQWRYRRARSISGRRPPEPASSINLVKYCCALSRFPDCVAACPAPEASKARIIVLEGFSVLHQVHHRRVVDLGL